MKTNVMVTLSLVVVCGLLVTACQMPGSKAAPSPSAVPAMEETQSGQESSMMDAKKSSDEAMANEEAAMKEEAGKEVTTVATYRSPAGDEQVGFTLTVDDQGVITNALAKVMAKAQISVMRQESFAKDFPAAVVGKKLSELEKIDRVGGSSLTTGAFNQALSELKSQI